MNDYRAFIKRIIYKKITIYSLIDVLASYEDLSIKYRLWNYYTDGFKGFSINYRKSEIDNALKQANVGYTSNKVYYEDKKEDLTDFYLTFQ